MLGEMILNTLKNEIVNNNILYYICLMIFMSYNYNHIYLTFIIMFYIIIQTILNL